MSDVKMQDLTPYPLKKEEKVISLGQGRFARWRKVK